MNPTLLEVSAKAGVSTATVSRVINESDLVTDETKEKVLAVIRELNYHPSRAARMLARQSTETIGVVFPDIQGGFFAEVLHGIDLEVAKTRYHLVTAFAHGRLDEVAMVERFLYERSVDALILMNLQLPDELLARLTESELRAVLIDRSARGLPSVGIDNETGVNAALSHLTQTLGYTKIGFLKGPSDTFDALSRWAACEDFAKQNGLNLEEKWILDGEFMEKFAFAEMEKLIESGSELPQAFFCLNDHMAFGVIEAFRKHSMRVPEDMALVGFDDGHTARMVRLTTVHVPMHEMGQLAAREAIAGKAGGYTAHVLPTELVIRDSCGSK